MNPHKPTLLDFYEFIYDRQKIWHKRFVLKQPAPWTKDKLLSTFRFCNVYRELDKCTIHLIDNVINSKLSIQDKVFNIILYRRFNTPEFFSLYGVQSSYNFKWQRLVIQMDMYKRQGDNLFNSAYIISQTPYDRNFGRREKHVQQILVLKDLSSKKTGGKLVRNLLEAPNLKSAFDLLTAIYGHGGFLAQQVLIDITYMKEFRNKWDINSFVDVGPGAKPAAKMLLPKLDYQEACRYLFSNQAKYFTLLSGTGDKSWGKIYYQNSIAGGKLLRITDIQNCLCEFRKYCHLQTNPDKRKRYYHGLHGNKG